MKFKVSLSVAALFAVTVFYGCNDNREDQSFYTVDLGANITESTFDNISQSLDVISVFQPEFTDSTVLSFLRRIDVRDDKILIQDNDGKNRNQLFAFDKDGKALSILNRYGQGPEEYSLITSWGLNDKNQWAIFDPLQKRIYQYDFDGSFISFRDNDSIFSLWHLPADKWICRSNTKTPNLDIEIYNNDWSLYETIPTPKSWTPEEREFSFDNYIFDWVNAGKYYLFDGTNSIIYGLDRNSGSMKEIIRFDMGKHQIPPFESQEQFRNIRIYEYIVIQSPPIFVGNYLFVNYYMNDVYFDVYDLRDGKLLFRNIANKDNQIYGMPVRLKEGEVRGWPIYADNKGFYFMVPEFEAAKLSDTDEVNPMIILVSIPE